MLQGTLDCCERLILVITGIITYVGRVPPEGVTAQLALRMSGKEAVVKGKMVENRQLGVYCLTKVT